MTPSDLRADADLISDVALTVAELRPLYTLPMLGVVAFAAVVAVLAAAAEATGGMVWLADREPRP